MIAITEFVFWLCISICVYTYLVFPLLMMLFAARRVRSASKVVDLPVVSVIIPAHNEEAVIREKIENSKQVDYPPGKLEIIVASDGSSDRTNEIVSSFESPQVRLLAFEQRRGKAAVVSDAVSEARGDVICFSDANVILSRSALKQLIGNLSDESIGAVSGDVRLESQKSSFGSGESLYYLIERQIQEAESSIGSMIGVDGGMYVVRRQSFQSVPDDTILDDFCISMNVIKKGKRVVYDSKAVATENATELALTEFKRRIRISSGAVQALFRGQFPKTPVNFWLFFSHKFLRWISPLVLISLFAANVFLVLQQPLYWIPLGLQLAMLTIALLGAVSRPVRWASWCGIPFYFALSQLAILVGLFKGLVSSPNPIWDRTARTQVADSPDLASARE